MRRLDEKNKDLMRHQTQPLTLQSSVVRSSLTGPLLRVEKGIWGGPKCCRPDREMAFLQQKQPQITQISNLSKRKETLDKGYGFYSGYSVGRDWVNREIIA